MSALWLAAQPPSSLCTRCCCPQTRWPSARTHAWTGSSRQWWRCGRSRSLWAVMTCRCAVEGGLGEGAVLVGAPQPPSIRLAAQACELVPAAGCTGSSGDCRRRSLGLSCQQVGPAQSPQRCCVSIVTHVVAGQGARWWQDRVLGSGILPAGQYESVACKRCLQGS